MRTAASLGLVCLASAALLGLANPALATGNGPSATSSSAPASGSPTLEPSGQPPKPLALPVILSPSTATPGTVVSIFACEPDQTGSADSTAFATTTMTPTNGYTAYGRATVLSTAKPGDHIVRVHCANGRYGQTNLKVLATPERPAKQTTETPSGAPDTGGGGTALVFGAPS